MTNFIHSITMISKLDYLCIYTGSLLCLLYFYEDVKVVNQYEMEK